MGGILVARVGEVQPLPTRVRAASSITDSDALDSRHMDKHVGPYKCAPRGILRLPSHAGR